MKTLIVTEHFKTNASIQDLFEKKTDALKTHIETEHFKTNASIQDQIRKKTDTLKALIGTKHLETYGALKLETSTSKTDIENKIMQNKLLIEKKHSEATG